MQALPGNGTKRLLSARPNAVTAICAIDLATCNYILVEAKAAAAAKLTTCNTVAPSITSRKDAQIEDNWRNFICQAVIGAKEGTTKKKTAIIGSAATDTVFCTPNGRNLKGVNEYELANIVAATITGLDRPVTKGVLD